MNDPYTLTPDRAAEPELGAQPDLRWRRGRDIADELDGYWLGAFVMAGTNSRIVRRSNALLDYAYGRRLEYAEQMSMGRSLAAPVAAALATGGNAAAMALGGRFFNRLPRKLVDRIAPKPGTGPSERARENGHYTVETYTTTTTGARYRATMSQQGRLRVQGHVGVAGGVRIGVGNRPRPAVGSAWGPHARGSDGRCVAGPIPRCRSVIGDNATELIRASRTPVDQDRLH